MVEIIGRELDIRGFHHSNPCHDLAGKVGLSTPKVELFVWEMKLHRGK